MSDLREALREAYTLLVSAEPTLIRDAETYPNATSGYYKTFLRNRVTAWLEPYRDDFDAGLTALAAVAPAPTIDMERLARAELRKTEIAGYGQPYDHPAEPNYEVWAVVFSNYDPPEVGAIYTNEAAAQADADNRGDPWAVQPWRIAAEYARLTEEPR